MNRILTVRPFILGATLLFLVCVLVLSVVGPIVAGSAYVDSGQLLGNHSTHDIALADVDGDDDLDAVSANNSFNLVWINNGSGFFNDSGQSLGTEESRGVAAGLLNEDDDPDVFIANVNADNAVWLNNGNGFFSRNTQTMDPAADTLDVALGDLDGDNDLDAFVANDGANQVWENDGAALFGLAQTLTGSNTSREVVLGDVDGDDDLDAYVANGSAGFERDELWINDGAGVFTTTAPLLDGDWNEAATLADLDGDDDLDVFLATWFGSDAVWLNDGSGNFTDSNQALSGNGSTDVTLVDVDGDLDLDAIVAKWTPDADEIWLNNGNGVFSLNPETLDPAATYEIAAGDLDGDTDEDLFFGDFGANHVWFRGGLPPLTAWFDVDARANSAGHSVYPWTEPGNALLPILLSFAPPAPVDVLARIEAPGGVMTETLPFAAGQEADTLNVTNPQPDVSATMTVSLHVTGGVLAPVADLVNPLSLTFVNAEQGDPLCSLCFLDWLLQLLGFEPSFWMLHHMELSALRDTPAWDHYHALFAGNAGEFSAVLAANPGLLWQSFDALESWTPAIQSLDDDTGEQVIVSQEMVNQAVGTLEGIRNAAGPGLAA